MLRASGPLELAGARRALGQRKCAGWPMQEQEVDIRKPQAHGLSLAARSSSRGAKCEATPGDDEHSSRRHPARETPPPLRARCHNILGGVDVAVAEAKRLLDHARAGPAAKVPSDTDRPADAQHRRLDDLNHSALAASFSRRLPLAGRDCAQAIGHLITLE